jgi:hypothetical protein
MFELQYGRNVSGLDHHSQLAASLRQGIRLYIEEKDQEMDIWLKIRKSDVIKRRNLTLVVTTFKVTTLGKNNTYGVRFTNLQKQISSLKMLRVLAIESSSLEINKG